MTNPSVSPVRTRRTRPAPRVREQARHEIRRSLIGAIDLLDQAEFTLVERELLDLLLSVVRLHHELREREEAPRCSH